MANHHQAPPAPEDDLFEQFLSYGYGADAAGASAGAGGGGAPFPLALSLDQGGGEGSASGKRIRDEPDKETVQMAGLFPPGYGQMPAHQLRHNPPPQVFHGQQKQGGAGPAGPQPPAPRPKVRARRGQATDPHSIAERLRRERIAERMRALQELVPNTNKTDRAAMLDEILDYVKFLKLQVKVLSMSRLGGAGAVAQLVADIPLSVSQGEASEGGSGPAGGSTEQIWEKWSTDGTERQVAKLMEENIGSAMQFLQSKALCMMPISLAMAIYDTNHNSFMPDSHQPSLKPEPNTPT
ncbi:hypothetical protein LUZ60_010206 [Juncus effusus]|nr:hypothetical protein LUZ60_010206 [Juncus effusus]